jgi:hypothetical protein
MWTGSRGKIDDDRFRTARVRSILRHAGIPDTVARLKPGASIRDAVPVFRGGAPTDETADEARIEPFSSAIEEPGIDFSTRVTSAPRLKIAAVRHRGSSLDALSDILHESTALARPRPESGL